MPTTIRTRSLIVSPAIPAMFCNNSLPITLPSILVCRCFYGTRISTDALGFELVVRSVEEFLSCGRLQGGFARIRCDKCRKEHLLAFSCRTRNFCASCQAKRSVLFAEKLAAEILAPVPHRHWTFSIPRVLRGLFERERALLSLLSQTAYASILKTFQALLGREDMRPGCVFSLQTFGAYGANFNPHCHGLVTDGAFSADGIFLPLPSLDASAVMEAFRYQLL